MTSKIPSDTQWQDLINRVKAKPSVADVIDLVYPVGSYYETSDTSFNPNTAWGGTWVEDTAGRVLVAKDSATFDTVGGTGGEETHTLTSDEMPSHTHTTKVRVLVWDAQGVNLGGLTSGSLAQSSGWNGNIVNNTGGGQAHNNLQPYIVVKRWHRTA